MSTWRPRTASSERTCRRHSLKLKAIIGLYILETVPGVRTCIVSYLDQDDIRHSVEITAASLFEADTDGTDLYFYSFRPGGFGAQDI